MRPVDGKDVMFFGLKRRACGNFNMLVEA